MRVINPIGHPTVKLWHTHEQHGYLACSASESWAEMKILKF